jgi:ClpP class serine protease
MLPIISKVLRNIQRKACIRRLEEKRGSRVITLIHRQETVSFIGLSIIKYITLEDAEDVVRAINLTSSSIPIDLIVHTPGGLVVATEQITNALKAHKAPVTIIVPNLAMSGGTMLALAGDEICMGKSAILGPVDPQLNGLPAVSILKALETPNPNRDDILLVLGDVSRKAINQIKVYVLDLLEAHYSHEIAVKVTEELTSGKWTHDYPISFNQAKALGLNVTDSVPYEVTKLMSLYKTKVSSTVDYIPVPYLSKPKA